MKASETSWKTTDSDEAWVLSLAGYQVDLGDPIEANLRKVIEYPFWEAVAELEKLSLTTDPHYAERLAAVYCWLCLRAGRAKAMVGYVKVNENRWPPGSELPVFWLCLRSPTPYEIEDALTVLLESPEVTAEKQELYTAIIASRLKLLYSYDPSLNSDFSPIVSESLQFAELIPERKSERPAFNFRIGLDAIRFLLEHDLSSGDLKGMPEYDREILGQARLGASFPKRLLLAINDPFYRASIRINAKIMALRESSTRG